MADTSARKEIMKVLFNTEIYQKLEDKLKEKAAEVSKSYDGIAEKQRLYLAEANAKDEAEFAALLAAREQQTAALVKRTAALQSRKEACEKERDAARETMAKFTQADKAAEELQKWERIVPEDEKAKAMLDRADRAAALMDLANQLQVARQDAAKRGQDLEALKQQGKKLATAYKQAEERFVMVQQQKPAHAAEREELIVLQGLLKVARELEQAKRDAAAKQTASEKGQQEAAAAKQQLLAAEQEFKALQQQAEALQKEALNVDALKLRQQNLLAEKEKAAAAARSEALVREAAADYEQAEQAAKKAETEWQAARAELAHLRELAKEARAVLLAEHLEEGEPCPVCGATHHPKLAEAVTEIVTDEMLKAKEADVSGFEQRHQAAAARAQEKSGKLAATKAEAEALVKQLAGREPAELAAELAKVKTALQGAQKAAEGYGSLMKAIERKQQEQKQQQERAAALEQRAAASAAEAAAAAALVQDKQAQLAGRELPAEPQEAAEKAAAAAEQDYHSLDTRYHAAQSAWKTKREELLRSQHQAAALQQSFAGRLVQAGFADEAAYEAALQGRWRASDYRDKVRRELLSHEQALHTARTNLTDCQKTIEKLEKPDLAEAEDAASAAQVAWQQALRESSAAETVLCSWQKRQKDLDALREQSGELTQTYARITGLSELASGKTGSRVSFQTYVLHSLLDDVMEMANQRLLIMSRGQYELHAGQRQRANQQGGLDMEIFDHYSGYARPLATLSGGESFLASLALALGLADVVQACTGGVRLDTMFIDEGFGTLDSETLDVALKALFELQKSGRLIGIISHVEELRSRIPARLEVTKTKSGGSTAHFELGTAES